MNALHEYSLKNLFLIVLFLIIIAYALPLIPTLDTVSQVDSAIRSVNYAP